VHRVLRAPADVAEDIGWPNATRAMAYLNRLVATPVTERQATAAAGPAGRRRRRRQPATPAADRHRPGGAARAGRHADPGRKAATAAAAPAGPRPRLARAAPFS
jgi:hypothetical protein